MRGRQALIAALALLGLVGAVAGVEATRGEAPAHRPVTFVPLGATGLPASPRSVLQVGRPRLLDRRHATIWAPVEHAVTATTRAGGGELVETVGTQTPERTQNLVLVLRERDAGRKTWAKVLLPSSSGTRSGWLPRSALGALHVVDTQILISLAHLQLTLLRNGAPVFRAAIGVGRTETPTPNGRFYIRDKLTEYASRFYGPIAFGTSARTAVLTEWPAGGYIGIHGTDEPELIPGRVSHGCIRLRNKDIVRLNRLLPVGTPITITRS